MLETPSRVQIEAPAPANRPRRLRRTQNLRDMVRETILTPSQLIQPLFALAENGQSKLINSMPGQSQWSVDRLQPEIEDLAEVGVPAVLLFGLPASKDPHGEQAWNPNGPVPRAIEEIKRVSPETIVIADVCMCEYTDHGHCGLIDHRGDVLNDQTLPLLARAAVAYADAGADIVAPSAMMDGQVGAIRSALDAAGHHNVAIMAYAAKFASAFYGPFREAADSAPQFGDRRAYQLDPGNGREALREVELDVQEGADMLMVKPAGPYLDILRQVRDRYQLPLAAYHVSGEYSMIKAAAERGWIDERRAAMEALTGIRRAGADLIITYYAKQAAGWLAETR